MSWMNYDEYHRESLRVGDIDPSYEMLRYICKRFELNVEQRYWLAFLYATCYCGPTVYYIYNEFPDYENVDIGRLERWWSANRSKLLFQTDRQWVRSRNQFCEMFLSYKKWLGGLTQQQKFYSLKTSNPYETYGEVWKEASKVYQMGRFALFLWLEAIHVVTEFPMKPKFMDLKEAESCRNGVAFAIGREDLMLHGKEGKLSPQEMFFLQQKYEQIVQRLIKEDQRNDVWNTETTLCAYKKYMLGKRYIGFYLNRQCEEIEKMQANVTSGVDWSVLWDYRRETYAHNYLREI